MITTLNKILVPVDFTTATLEALQYARPLATQFGSTVRLLHVIEHASFLAGEESVSLWKPATVVGHETKAAMEDLCRRYLDPSTQIECQATSGHPAMEILRDAQANNCQMIILTTHGLKGWRHVFRSSTTQAVMRSTPCPVLLVHCPKPVELDWESNNDTTAAPDDSKALRNAA